MSIRSTYTYAILEVSAAAYDEIRGKLNKAGYSDQFHKDEGAEVIDMHGIALKAVRVAEPGPSELKTKAENARSRF